MKKLLYILVLMTTAGCHDLLDKEPLINFAPENYFSTEKEIVTGVNATYDPLSSGGGRNTLYWAGVPLLLDFLSDDVVFGGSGGFGEAERLDLTVNNGFTRRAYLGYYEIVNRANLMLENIPKVSMPEARKNRYAAEVRFLRAFAYYHLTFFWGEVSLRQSAIKTFEDGPIGPSPTKQIYALIDEDLAFAIEHLPWTYGPENYGRATKGAALALAAKSQMVRKSWAAALPYTERIINDPGSPHSLIPLYKDVFTSELKNHPEHIFSARFAGGLEALNEGGILEERYGPPRAQAPAGFLPGNSNSIARPSWYNGTATNIRNGLINEYLATNDPRLDQAYVNFNATKSPAQYYVDKFRDKSPHLSGNASTVFPLIRFSDVLLMHAEILNEINKGPTPEAYAAMNRVRQRANNGAPEGKILADISGLTYETFQKAVYHERRMELSHEGHRWIDLVRTGRMMNVMGAHLGKDIESFRQLFPIPGAELDANPAMKQNFGY